jgi:hypothetical protein
MYYKHLDPVKDAEAYYDDQEQSLIEQRIDFCAVELDCALCDQGIEIEAQTCLDWDAEELQAAIEEEIGLVYCDKHSFEEIEVAVNGRDWTGLWELGDFKPGNKKIFYLFKA